MSSYNNNSNFDSLLLQSLMGRLQLRPPYLNTNSFLSQSLEDFLLDANNAIPDNDDDDDDDDDNNNKTQLAKEESKLEREIIRVILSGKTETLKPNSGQAVAIGEHHICIGFHEEKGSDYRVWEWHGHIMLFDDENGYSPEYIYGNYFERLPVTAVSDDENDGETVEKGRSLGLRGLIDSVDPTSGRVLRRNMNAGSPKF